jgi:acyl carrier protein
MLDWKTQIIDRIAKKSPETGVVITPDTSFDDLGIESLDQIELIFELEEQFDVELPYNANLPAGQTLELATVGDLIALVAGQIDQSSTARNQPAIQTEALELS